MSRTEEKNEEKVQGRRFLEYLYMKIPVWRKIEDMSKRFGDGWKDIFDDFRTDLIKATASTTFHFSTNSYDL